MAGDPIKIEGDVIRVRSKETPAYENATIRLSHGNDAAREVLHLALSKQRQADAKQNQERRAQHSERGKHDSIDWLRPRRIHRLRPVASPLCLLESSEDG
jgi:hypothetical protein